MPYADNVQVYAAPSIPARVRESPDPRPLSEEEGLATHLLRLTPHHYTITLVSNLVITPDELWQAPHPGQPDWCKLVC